MSVAAFLGRAGHHVSVFDKAPAPAPVGSGLIVQPTGQAVLNELGLRDQLNRRGVRLDRLDGRTQNGKRKVLDVRYSALAPNANGVSVHRAALFEILHSAAEKAGAALNYGYEALAIKPEGEARRLEFAGGVRSVEADLVVDASGVRSPFVKRRNCFLRYGALWANAPFPETSDFAQNVLSQRYRGAGCSSGVMPIGTLDDDGEKLAAFFWTLRADEFEAWRGAPLTIWKEKALTFWPEAAPVLDHFISHDQFVFAHYAHHTFVRPVEGRTVHIGDAWHAASPQLGQGANMALLDALALATAFEMNNSVMKSLEAFVRMRRAHVRLYQAASFLFTPVYQSDSRILPALRDIFAQPVSSIWPMPRLLASMVAGTLGNPLKPILANGSDKTLQSTFAGPI